MATNIPARSQPGSVDSDATLQPPKTCLSTEFDPCADAKPCSPFYLYKHDSPRPSMDGPKFKTTILVSERDLELGETITPSLSLEKVQSQKSQTPKKSKFTLWKRKSLRITPKKQGRIARLPKKQRYIVRGLIAFFVIGAMIGIAVGIAAGLQSGVWKSNNQQAKIGSS